MELKKENYPDILNQFIDKMIVDRKSEKTIINYSGWISNFLQFSKYIKFRHSKNAQVKDLNISEIPNSIFKKINIDDIEEFKKYLSQEGSNGNSINRKLASIQTFFKFLVQKNIIDNNIFFNVDRVKQTEKVREPLTKKEVELLLKTIKNSNNKYKDRYYFLFLLYAETGARCFELTKLKLNQIYNNEYLLIKGKGDKERPIYLSNDIINFLKKYLEYREQFLKDKNIQSDYLFVNQQGNNLSESTVLLELKEFARQAGLNENLISPHVLRHSAATIKFEDGHSDIRTLQEFLGHSSINTTERYVAVSINKKKQLANCVSFDL